jgi:hypothetical protein
MNNNAVDNHIQQTNSVALSPRANYNHIQFINHAFGNPFHNTENKYSTIKEIEQIINSLKTKNSFGCDGISSKILKLSAPFISSPISYAIYKLTTEILNSMNSKLASGGIFCDLEKAVGRC